MKNYLKLILAVACSAAFASIAVAEPLMCTQNSNNCEQNSVHNKRAHRNGQNMKEKCNNDSCQQGKRQQKRDGKGPHGKENRQGNCKNPPCAHRMQNQQHNDM